MPELDGLNVQKTALSYEVDGSLWEEERTKYVATHSTDDVDDRSYREAKTAVRAMKEKVERLHEDYEAAEATCRDTIDQAKDDAIPGYSRWAKALRAVEDLADTIATIIVIVIVIIIIVTAILIAVFVPGVGLWAAFMLAFQAFGGILFAFEAVDFGASALDYYTVSDERSPGLFALGVEGALLLGPGPKSMYKKLLPAGRELKFVVRLTRTTRVDYRVVTEISGHNWVSVTEETGSVVIRRSRVIVNEIIDKPKIIKEGVGVGLSVFDIDDNLQDLADTRDIATFFQRQVEKVRAVTGLVDPSRLGGIDDYFVPLPILSPAR